MDLIEMMTKKEIVDYLHHLHIRNGVSYDHIAKGINVSMTLIQLIADEKSSISNEMQELLSDYFKNVYGYGK